MTYGAGRCLTAWLFAALLGELTACSKVAPQPTPPPPPAVKAPAKPPVRPRQAKPFGQSPGWAPEAPLARLQRAADAQQPKPPEPTELKATVTEPRRPKPEDVNRAVQGAMGALAGCFAGSTAAAVGVRFDIEASGGTRNVRVSGASDQQAYCIRTTLAQAVRLQPFEGAPIEVDLPLSVGTRAPSSTTHTAQVGGAGNPTRVAPAGQGAAASPSGPFVNP